MKFTRKQFDEIGPFYLDDCPIDDENQDFMFKVFNSLPNNLQWEAVSWDCSDTVFRDNAFTYILDKQLGMTPDEYYNSALSALYFDSGKTIVFDFNKMNEND